MSFHGLSAHFVLHWIRFHCLDVPVYLPIHPVKHILVVSRFWKSRIKLLGTSLCGVLCGRAFRLCWVALKKHSCWIDPADKGMPSCEGRPAMNRVVHGFQKHFPSTPFLSVSVGRLPHCNLHNWDAPEINPVRAFTVVCQWSLTIWDFSSTFSPLSFPYDDMLTRLSIRLIRSPSDVWYLGVHRYLLNDGDPRERPP